MIPFCYDPVWLQRMQPQRGAALQRAARHNQPCQEGNPVSTATILPAREQAAKKLTTLIYILHAAGSLTGGLTTIAAIIMIYIKREEVAGTLFESHFRWQLRTFWFGFLWIFIGALLTMVFIGGFVLIAAGIWYIYRLVKGYLNLNDSKAMYS